MDYNVVPAQLYNPQSGDQQGSLNVLNNGYLGAGQSTAHGGKTENTRHFKALVRASDAIRLLAISGWWDWIEGPAPAR
jgi:hypothetical protein